MTYRIDLSAMSDRRDAIHQIVEALVGGGIARLTLEGRRCLLALATNSRATGRLASLKAHGFSALMVSGAEAAADFVPALSPRASRVFQRAHAPIHLLFAEGADKGLVHQLPVDAADLAFSEPEVRLAVPVGEVARGVLRFLPGPAVVLELLDEKGLDEKTIGDLADIEVGVNGTTPPGPPTMIRFRGDNWTLIESGGQTKEDIDRMMAERIVFVCTGNTCRSPMAEGVFRKLLAERLACSPDALPQYGFEVASAGVAATAGAPASPESVAICADYGIDLRSHASQPLEQPLLESSDRLYAMTAGHRDAIRDRFPEHASRVQMLSRTGMDVSDPIGSGFDAYERCFGEITENLHLLVDELTGPGR